MSAPRKEEHPHDRLTHLCNAMIERLDEHPASEGVKCVIMLDDGERGGMVFHGYEDDDQADALADIFVHLGAIFEANGKRLVVAPIPGQG